MGELEIDKNQLEIQKQFREQQSKYIYYLIALSVAAIAYTIDKTTGDKVDVKLIPAGIAILCWGISVFSGFKFIEGFISSLSLDNDLFELKKGNSVIAGLNPLKQNIVREEIFRIINKKQKCASVYGNLIVWCFFLGIIFFIIWHIWKLY